MTDAVWMPDDASDKCLVCDAAFGLLSNRKHHCRLCGHLVCSSCLGLEEASQSYLTGPAQAVTALIPPLAPLKCLAHPNVSATRTTVSSWLPQAMRRHTHIDPVAPKLCLPCGVRLAKERAAYNRAHALCGALTLLSKYRQRVVLRMALHSHDHYRKTRDPALLNEFAVLGRWTEQLSNLKFYLEDVRKYNRYPFMRQLMLILYSHWYEYADAPDTYITDSEMSTVLTLMLNRAHSAAEIKLDPKSPPPTSSSKKCRPSLMLSSKRLKALLNNPANAMHFLIGHQLLHYRARVKEPIIRNCWNSLFSQTESLALFMHHRLCCDVLCVSKQATQLVDAAPYNGMFLDFFDFLKLRLKRVSHARTPPTYKQAVCALLHNSMYCQPQFAQGCAHVLHLDLATVHTFYERCYNSLWAVTQGQPFCPLTIENPLEPYSPCIQIIKLAEAAPSKSAVLAVSPASAAQVVHVETSILIPIYEPLYAYAIQHLVRLFYRAYSSDLTQRERNLCASLNLFFGPSSLEDGKTVGHVNASILKFGEVQLVDADPASPPSISILTYLVMYLILTMHDMLGREEPEGLPLVTIMPDKARLVMPYTLRACLDIRKHLCSVPITDTTMADVKGAVTYFIDYFLPDIWVAFYPLAQSLDDSEAKLYAYFNHLTRVLRTDTFRSSFLNLIF